MTKKNEPTRQPAQEFKFLPHRTSPMAFWLSHIAHICLLPPSAAGLRPPQAKECNLANPHYY